MILFQILMNVTLIPVAMEPHVLTVLIRSGASAFRAMSVHFVNKVRADATSVG